MTEIYWITRLDCFNSCIGTITVIGLIASLVLLISYYICNGQMIYDNSRGYERSAEEFKGYKETCISSLKVSIPITIITSMFYIFIPTTNEALVIYGVGGTIDYLKSNSTAKQLPDKCINALDKWVDTWNVDNKENIEKTN